MARSPFPLSCPARIGISEVNKCRPKSRKHASNFPTIKEAQTFGISIVTQSNLIHLCCRRAWSTTASMQVNNKVYILVPLWRKVITTWTTLILIGMGVPGRSWIIHGCLMPDHLPEQGLWMCPFYNTSLMSTGRTWCPHFAHSRREQKGELWFQFSFHGWIPYA